MQDTLQHEETVKGKEARQHLQFMLVATDHLDEVMAGLSFLEATPAIDAKRIAIAGHSFGGQLALLAEERDNTLRAAVAFAAAANSWERSSELRQRLLNAANKATTPIMLIHAANDYSTVPGYALASELERLHKPHLLKIIRLSVEPRRTDTISFTLRCLSGSTMCLDSLMNTSNADSAKIMPDFSLATVIEHSVIGAYHGIANH